MHIPRTWARAAANGLTPDGRQIPVSIWGWGDDESGARKEAANRLARMLERIARGEPLPGRYAYGSRPLREEILQTFESEASGPPSAMLTRNGYGAQVLNTAALLFLDVDLPERTRFRRWLNTIGLSRDDAENTTLTKLRDALQRYGRATFRLYRTASGFRAIAIDRQFEPTGREAQELMHVTGTDPAFVRLCSVQRSFRARLTPKPWRCGTPVAPGEHPREDAESRQRFAAWLAEYDRASSGYATSRYLETIGTGRLAAFGGKLIDLHDRATRCDESLPLA